jgi:hypothetical protein
MSIYTIEKNDAGTWEKAVFYADDSMTVVDCTKDRDKAISVASKRAEFYKYQTRVLEDFIVIHHFRRFHEEGIVDLLNPPMWVAKYKQLVKTADVGLFPRYEPNIGPAIDLVDFLLSHNRELLGIWSESFNE